jgi:hemerythrin-like domain-containing protein
MRLIAELRAEHELIDAAVGALRAWDERRLAGAAPADDGARFVRFFRVYAAGFHHAREEDVLFPALLESAGLPDVGPIATLTADHRETAALLGRIEALCRGNRRAEEPAGELGRLVVRYSHALWQHIDAESSVLFPESEPRLRRAGVRELPSRALSDEERAARDLGRRLVRAYPPIDDRAIVRGDGCVCCPAYGVGCAGLERSWWSDSEWDELADHIGEG